MKVCEIRLGQDKLKAFIGKEIDEGHLWKAQWKEKSNDEGHKKLTMNKIGRASCRERV